MSKEAMKLSLEAFQRLDLWLKLRCQVGLVGFELDAVKALEEALANHCEDNLDMVKQEQGEPVAWRIRWTDGSVSYREEEPSDACKSECEVTALCVKE